MVLVIVLPVALWPWLVYQWPVCDGPGSPSGVFSIPPSLVFRLLQLHKSVVTSSGSLPNELLYGRMGYLYSLIFINQQFQHEKIPLQYIQQVCDAVLASGQHLSQRMRIEDQSPLMYEWYQEQYVGAAHGLSGIYYYLMQPGFVSDQGRLLALVKPSVDLVCRLKFPSGNYPPCVGDERDLLVHWCHGSPGVIYMLLQAYKVFGVQQYLEDAIRCGELVWQRGLLKKGYGLCHGAAGNAYCFLSLYKLTHDPRHLYRACMFADWCMNYGKHGCRTPDTPFSLFEGTAVITLQHHSVTMCILTPAHGWKPSGEVAWPGPSTSLLTCSSRWPPSSQLSRCKEINSNITCRVGSVLWGYILWVASCGGLSCGQCPVGSVLWGYILWVVSCGQRPVPTDEELEDDQLCTV
ncbi:hypothetical protein NFI96_031677 [Prochilodus magdalenae]|nr:hypothetical protein NFI96_031677 [Prochilodus magdalenae]